MNYNENTEILFMIEFLAKKLILIPLVIAIGALGTYFFVFSKKVSPKLLTVARGDIAEEVIVTGNTKPVQDINLAFQTSGKIARVNVSVGNKVAVGETLVELDASQLMAQLKEAEANAAAAQAKLDALKRGTRPEDIQITRTAIAKAEQDLANDYNGVLATLNDAYSKSDDAIRNQLSAIFTSADTIAPQLAFLITDSQIQIDVQSQRALTGSELVNWKKELAVLNSRSTDSGQAASRNSTDTLDGALKNTQSHFGVILAFLNKVMDAVVNSATLNSTTVASYKTSVTTAKSEVTTATTNANNATQAIASQKLVVRQQNDELNLQLAGSTPEDIRAQEAAVAQTVASIAVIQAQLNQTVIHSPIEGTVTKQDAKVGQIESANQTLVSVISTDNLEIDASVPEVDIGKIAVSNNVYIALDAFPGETFTGKIVKIDPAETVVDGVVRFKVTAVFDKSDPRFKSGLTANLRIEAKRKIGVLILPQIAIIQNDQGAFVKKYENGATKETRVTLGVRDQSGNVEIVSGVNDGDTVLNVGLKTSQ